MRDINFVFASVLPLYFGISHTVFRTVLFWVGNIVNQKMESAVVDMAATLQNNRDNEKQRSPTDHIVAMGEGMFSPTGGFGTFAADECIRVTKLPGSCGCMRSTARYRTGRIHPGALPLIADRRSLMSSIKIQSHRLDNTKDIRSALWNYAKLR